MSRFDVRANDVRDPFRRIKTSDLDNVVSQRVEKFTYSPLHAKRSEHLHVELLVERPHRFIETIKPIVSIDRMSSYQSDVAGTNPTLSRGTSLGTNLLTG